jgi:hypothetical protein
MKLCGTKSCHRRRRLVLLCLLLFPPTALLLGNVPTAQAQAAQKVVQGKVVDASDQPRSGAIVYLKNSKTSDIKSFISTADEVWADYQGKKSPTKTVSSFDSKKLLIYELKVGAGK